MHKALAPSASRLRSLAQSGKQPHAGITVGRFDAEIALVIEHRKACRIANAAIGAAGIETERSKPALQFLNFGEGRWRLAIGKLLDEGWTADTSIAQITKAERVALCRIVAARREEIRPQEKRRAAGDRQPSARGGVGLREGLPVGGPNVDRLPGCVAARACAADRAGHAHFVAPMLAASIAAALDEIAGRGRKRVVRRAVGRNLAVAVIVDAEMEPDFRHPLG